MAKIYQNRRDFLGSATALASGSFIGTLPNQDDSEDITVVEEQRSYQNPLTQREVEEIQNEAIKEHRDRTDSSKPIGKGAINPDEDLPAISFIYMIDKDSRSRFHVGRAREDENKQGAMPITEMLRNVHSTASTRLETARDTNSIVTASSRLNEPVKKQEIRAKFVTGGTTETAINPHGRVVSAVELYKFGVLYGIRQNLTVIPGVNQYSRPTEKWRNRAAQAAHHWGRNDFEHNIHLIGHEPHGYKKGEEQTVVQIDTGGGGLEWNYVQPDVERMDKTSSETAKWTWSWNSSKARESTAVFKLGSLIQPPETASAGDKITATRSEVTFRKRRSPVEEQLVPNSQSISLG